MDAVLLARIQFALTISFHYIYPPLSIGLGVIMVIMGALFLRTKNPLYQQMMKFWVRIFGLTFALGVATGVVMEFEFGTNWANYSRFVGDVFGSALAAEGITLHHIDLGGGLGIRRGGRDEGGLVLVEQRIELARDGLAQLVGVGGLEEVRRRHEIEFDGGDDGHWQGNLTLLSKYLRSEVQLRRFLALLRVSVDATLRQWDSYVGDVELWSARPQ